MSDTGKCSRNADKSLTWSLKLRTTRNGFMKEAGLERYSLGNYNKGGQLFRQSEFSINEGIRMMVKMLSFRWKSLAVYRKYKGKVRNKVLETS